MCESRTIINSKLIVPLKLVSSSSFIKQAFQAIPTDLVMTGIINIFFLFNVTRSTDVTSPSVRKQRNYRNFVKS